MFKLRQYQAETVAAIYEALRTRDDNSCAVLPTGSGKSLVLAQVCKDTVLEWSGRVLVLAHVHELLSQNGDTILRLAPELFGKVGLHSAGLKSRDTKQACIVAGVQSVYRKACDLGRFDLVIIDEAHLIPEAGDGMYRTLLADLRIINPALRIIGLTATPYRMTTGVICTPGGILNHICYDAGLKMLINEGYLSPLISKAGALEVDTSKLHIRGGEFIPGEAEAAMDTIRLVESACQEIISYAKNRRACLIFASGVDHGRHVAETLNGLGAKAETVFGDTDNEERTRIVSQFKTGAVKFLVNCGVFTTGFDYPGVDCIALLRPTMSPGLFVQMVGRGSRIVVDVNRLPTAEARKAAIAASAKPNCLILDFGGNTERHGPVDQIRVTGNSKAADGTGEAPAKKCPECRTLIACGYGICPECGFVFPAREIKHDSRASLAGILSGQVTTEDHAVFDVRYTTHYKRGGTESDPPTLRVEYLLANGSASEWICFEHTGWARTKAESWWRKRSKAPVPKTVDEAEQLAFEGALCWTDRITVRKVVGEKYDRIVGYQLGDVPVWVARDAGEDRDEIPVDDPKPLVESSEEVPF